MCFFHPDCDRRYRNFAGSAMRLVDFRQTETGLPTTGGELHPALKTFLYYMPTYPDCQDVCENNAELFTQRRKFGIITYGKINEVQKTMFEKLQGVAARYREIGEKLTDPDVLSDLEAYRDLMKEYKALTPVVQTYESYCRAKTQVEEAESLLATPLEEEFRDMVAQELADGKILVAGLAQELRILLLPKDPNDDRSVILEIRAGAGGEEAALFAHSLFRMYTMFADAHGFKTEILSENETELGGFREVTFSVDGQGAYSRLKFESGVHRVQRVPETESQGRIQTSTVTVAVLPEAEDVDVQIAPGDLIIETHRSAGAGGQHVNKTESAIRVIHVPTGIVVDCQDERSQYKNKDRALKLLRAKLLEKKQTEQAEKIAADRRSQVGTGDRSERIRTYNFPQGRVTDHRIGLTLYKLLQILDGDLDELIDALVTADQARRLAGEDGTDT